jgi:hypothetical protein
MHLARTLFVGLLVLAALGTASGAGAKGAPPYAVAICGPAGCARVVAVSNWNEPAWLSDQSLRAAPAAPAPFYTLGTLYPGSHGTTSPVVYYVPSAGLIKLKGSIPGRGEAIWLKVAPDVATLLDRAAGGLSPFHRPRISWAMVGTRWIKHPGSYARLYLLDGAVAPDPAGSPPSLQYQTSDRDAWFAAWSPYLDRINAEWLRVQMGTRAPSPWDIRESFVWVGRRLDLLKRDGNVIQIPTFVVELIRRGGSL